MRELGFRHAGGDRATLRRTQGGLHLGVRTQQQRSDQAGGAGGTWDWGWCHCKRSNWNLRRAASPCCRSRAFRSCGTGSSCIGATSDCRRPHKRFVTCCSPGSRFLRSLRPLLRQSRRFVRRPSIAPSATRRHGRAEWIARRARLRILQSPARGSHGLRMALERMPGQRIHDGDCPGVFDVILPAGRRGMRTEFDYNGAR